MNPDALATALQAIADGPAEPAVRRPHPDVMTAAEPAGALPLARHANLDLFEHALQRYLLRYLAGDGMTREEKLANLPHVENELATMLGHLHAAKAPDYNVRANMVAKEINWRIAAGNLDVASGVSPDAGSKQSGETPDTTTPQSEKRKR